MNWYKESQNLCETDMTPRQLVQEESNHGLGMTKAFRTKIKPILDTFLAPQIKRKLEPLSRRWGENYLQLFWEQSFMKALNPRDGARCNNELLGLFVKGKWNKISEIFLGKLLEFAEKSDSKQDNIGKRLVNKDGYTTVKAYRALEDRLQAEGIRLNVFTTSITRDNPPGIKQKFMDGDLESVYKMVVELYSPYISQKKQRIDLNKRLTDIYQNTIAIDPSLRNIFDFGDFQNLFYSTNENARQNFIQARNDLKKAIETNHLDFIVPIVKKYLNSLPRNSIPEAYKKYVAPIDPDWLYQSFYNMTKNDPTLKQAIMDDNAKVIQDIAKRHKNETRQHIIDKRVEDPSLFSNPRYKSKGAPESYGPRIKPPSYFDLSEYGEKQRELV